MECKKAQPKETVASLNLLAKRMVLPLSASSLAAQGSPTFSRKKNFSRFFVRMTDQVDYIAIIIVNRNFLGSNYSGSCSGQLF